MFLVLQLFALFVVVFLGRHASGDQKGQNNATRCVMYTREKLQVGTLWMTSEKEITELKGKSGPSLHHAILLFSI